MKLAILVAVIVLAAVIGVGFYVTDFTAYLGNNPTTCNNCHVMDAVYEGWYHGGHKEWATCNDCHTPHALIPKYLVKAQSGYHHVTAFVFGTYPRCHPRQAGFQGSGPGELHPLPPGYRLEHRLGWATSSDGHAALLLRMPPQRGAWRTRHLNLTLPTLGGIQYR